MKARLAYYGVNEKALLVVPKRKGIESVDFHKTFSFLNLSEKYKILLKTSRYLRFPRPKIVFDHKVSQDSTSFTESSTILEYHFKCLVHFTKQSF